MKAVVFVPGPAGGIAEIRDVPKPAIQSGQVLVRVRAAGLNRGELGVLGGLTKGTPQQTGIEFAGEIEECAADVRGFSPGDRVMGHWRAGQAEYVAADHRVLMRVPAGVRWADAGAFVNVFTTAHDAIVSNGLLQAGESILINAASSGIGMAAIQIARLKGAKPVIASSGSGGKLAQLAPLGVDIGIDTANGGLADAVLRATDGKGVDLIIDSVGASVFSEHMRCMALGARLVGVGRLGGKTCQIDLDLLALRRLKLIGVTFRTRSDDERAACVQAAARDLLPAFAAGRIRPLIDQIYPMSAVREAHARMLSNQHIGKIVLEI
jgi:NADPH2:quinone reductase